MITDNIQSWCEKHFDLLHFITLDDHRLPNIATALLTHLVVMVMVIQIIHDDEDSIVHENNDSNYDDKSNGGWKPLLEVSQDPSLRPPPLSLPLSSSCQHIIITILNEKTTKDNHPAWSNYHYHSQWQCHRKRPVRITIQPCQIIIIILNYNLILKDHLG